ncbi:MAG: hypothetical protein ACI9EK_002759 [Psychroserpens sp.]
MSNKNKYIYIVNVTRQLSIDMINHFYEKGDEIHLITGIQEVNYEKLNPNIKVTYLNKYNNITPIKRVYTWVLFTFLSFFYVLFSNRKKEIILITSPPFIIFLGLLLMKLKNQKYHLIIWDLYPDVLINFGVFKENSIIIKLWKKLNKKCFKHASTIITLGIHLSEAVKKYTDKEPVIIRNWVNTDFIIPMQKSENPFAIKHNLVDKVVVMYSGNMGVTHDIESIVNTAELLQNKKEIQFLIIGDGAKKRKITQMVADKNLTNVLLLPFQEKETLPFSLASADIGIVTLSEGAESVSVPSKTYYTLSAGSAIIALASKESELALLIEKYKCGEIFDLANPKWIADYIFSLSENKDELNVFKENARKASFDFTTKNAEDYYNYIHTTK